MLLKELISGLEYEKILGFVNSRIDGIAYDSRKVKSNHLFACLQGVNHDGHKFAGESIKKGARAVICQRDIENWQVPRIIVGDSRRALSSVSAKFYGHPSKEMNVVGVTGTNGKTSVTFLCEAICREAGFETGVIGTISYRWGGRTLPASQTTPESLEIQHMLRQMRDQKCEYAFIEASSHGISQQRVSDVEFKSAVFTNLSPEHMDYHSTLEDYFNSKCVLFEKLLSPGGASIINIDDPFGRKLAERLPGPKITNGLDGSADVRASGIRLGNDGVSFRIDSDFGGGELKMKLLGMGSVYNALSSICCGFVNGIGLDTMFRALQQIERIKGRFEIINRGGDFTVAIDYAHTPSALSLLLESARKFCAGRIITVFGCGGDRDRSKRAVMGKIAALNSDYSVLTTDNPRSEDPRSIVSEIEEGFAEAGKDNYAVVLDRGEAISFAVSKAGKNDIVLIAGKGHETYQISRNTIIPFDDSEAAREALENIRPDEFGA